MTYFAKATKVRGDAGAAKRAATSRAWLRPNPSADGPPRTSHNGAHYAQGDSLEDSLTHVRAFVRKSRWNITLYVPLLQPASRRVMGAINRAGQIAAAILEEPINPICHRLAALRTAPEQTPVRRGPAARTSPARSKTSR